MVAAWVYIAIMAGAMMSMRSTAIIALVLAVGMLLLARIDHQPAPWELAGVLIGLSLWMCAFMGNIRLTRELQRTRRELADAAVAAERARIGRDLHDILGHSLTAIAVKAGLARRLLEHGADGAQSEIGDIERMAREALADVRATASGFRDISLASELSVAASVLRAAGIRPVLPQAVEHVNPAARQLFGYVVREAVTNVVRHSRAGSCTITLGSDTVEIRDDGTGSARENPIGSGLAGLTERVREAGGTVGAGPIPGGGFAVRATLPDPKVIAAQTMLPLAGESAR
jgi:two-component system sensor histidine kinase DesK